MNQRLSYLKICSLLCWLLLLATVGPAWSGERLVSVILTGNLERYQAVQQAFLQNLNQEQVKVYTQTPNPDPMSLANSIRKAVAINSDLIVTYGAQAAVAAKREAGSVPVLFADVYDPVNLGLVKCLENVSCDVSGVSASTPLKTLLKTLADLAPAQRTIAALFSANDPGSVLQTTLLKSLAVSLGFRVETYDLSSVKAIDQVLYHLYDREPILFISESALIQQHIEQILSFAKKKRLMIVSQVPGLCDKGALLTLEPKLAEQGTKLAEYANSVLKGTPTSTLPVVSPHKVDLVLNLEVARLHQLDISLQTLNRATRIIKAKTSSEQVK